MTLYASTLEKEITASKTSWLSSSRRVQENFRSVNSSFNNSGPCLVFFSATSLTRECFAIHTYIDIYKMDIMHDISKGFFTSIILSWKATRAQ